MNVSQEFQNTHSEVLKEYQNRSLFGLTSFLYLFEFGGVVFYITYLWDGIATIDLGYIALFPVLRFGVNIIWNGIRIATRSKWGENDSRPWIIYIPRKWYMDKTADVMEKVLPALTGPRFLYIMIIMGIDGALFLPLFLYFRIDLLSAMIVSFIFTTLLQQKLLCSLRIFLSTTVACLVILPHGILTFSLGRLFTNVLGLQLNKFQQKNARAGCLETAAPK